MPRKKLHKTTLERRRTIYRRRDTGSFL